MWLTFLRLLTAGCLHLLCFCVCVNPSLVLCNRFCVWLAKQIQKLPVLKIVIFSTALLTPIIAVSSLRPCHACAGKAKGDKE